jgi:hypothetical protein
MLDFTFNPFIALWFSVKQHLDDDGRVFAIDIADKSVRRRDAVRPDPWWWKDLPRSTDEWATESWIWRPPPLEPRMVRQEGCHVMGGVPSTQPARTASVDGEWRFLRAAEVRAAMSVPFQLVKYEQAEAAYRGDKIGGKQPEARGFTIRITNKPALLRDLEQVFDYDYPALFPDFPGFSDFGLTWTRRAMVAPRKP